MSIGCPPSRSPRTHALSQEHDRDDLSCCLIEKGSEIGAHILSGNVFSPRALDELFPSWRQMDSPLTTPASQDHFYFLTDRQHYSLPTIPALRNEGNFVMSLSKFTRWLADQAEEIGKDQQPATLLFSICCILVIRLRMGTRRKLDLLPFF